MWRGQVQCDETNVPTRTKLAFLIVLNELLIRDILLIQEVFLRAMRIFRTNFMHELIILIAF